MATKTTTPSHSRIERGPGGELHPVTSDTATALTANQGGVIADDQNSLRTGERGPTLLEDFVMRERTLRSRAHSGASRARAATVRTATFSPTPTTPR